MAANRIYIQVDFQQAQAVQGVNQLNQAITSIGPATQRATAQASQGVSGMSLSIQQAQNAFSGIGSALAGIGALRIGQNMLQTAMSFERARLGLEALTGSAEEAGKTFAEIQKYAQTSPFEMKELLAAENRLLAMQFTAKESIPILRAVGAAMGAIGGENAVGKMNDVINALGQVKAAGRLTGEEIRQLRNAAIPVMPYLAQAFGKTQAQVQKMVTDGLVPADKAIRALVEGMQNNFGKFEQAVGRTASVALSNFNDAWDKFADQVIKDYLPKLTTFINETAIPALTKFSQVLKDNKEAIEALGVAIALFMAGKAVAGFIGLMAKIAKYVPAAVYGGEAVGAAAGAAGAASGAGAGAAGAAGTAGAGAAGAAAAGGATALGFVTLGVTSALTGAALAAKNYADHTERINREMEKLNFKVKDIDPDKMQFAGLAYPRKAGTDLMRYEQIRIKDEPPGRGEPPPPTEEQIRKAKQLADYIERMRESTAAATKDALSDLQGFVNAQKPLAQQLPGRLEAVVAEMQKKATQLEQGMTGRKVDLPKDVLASLAKEGTAKASKVILDWMADVRKGAQATVGQIGEDWLKGWQETTERENEIRRQGWNDEIERAKEAQAQIEQERNSQIQNRIRSQHDIALAELDTYQTTTLAQQMALAGKRLEIEQEYVDKALQENLRLLEVEHRRLMNALTMKAVLDKTYGTPAWEAMMADEERLYQMRKQGYQSDAATQKDLNRIKTIADQQQMVRNELQQTFEYFQNLAEGVFDALLGKGKSIAEAMADFVKTTVLTMIKAIYTNVIAAMMMSAFGLPVPQQKGNPVLRMLTGGGGTGGMGGRFSLPGNVVNIASGAAGGGYAGGGTGGTYSGGGGFMSYAGTAGTLASLGKAGWLKALFSGGGKFVPRALTGPIGQGVPMGLNAGVNATNMAWTGALQTSGIAGSTGLAATLAGMGLFNTGSIAMGGYATTAAGIGGLGGALAGFASSPGGIAAGLALLGYGVKRGGKLGAVMTTGGGALSGFGIGAAIGSVGGPLGMAIGAGIGGVLGLIGLLRKSAEDKVRERIKQIYQVDITENKVLQQILEIAKEQYGGDLNSALYAPQVREVIRLWKVSKSSDEGRPMYPVSFAMSGGSLNMQPVYNGGGIVANPYSGPTTTQVNATPVYVQLNPQQANDLFEGKVVQVIDANPAAVANSNTRVAGDSSGRRMAAQNAILEPLTLLN